MNFVVSFALGVIVVGVTIWRMSRNDDVEDDSGDSKAVSIEIINGDSNGDNGEDGAKEIAEEIVIEHEGEPQSSDDAEEIVEEIVIEHEDGPQSGDAADAESAESADSDENDAEEIVEEIMIESENDSQSSDVANVEIADSMGAEHTEAEETETHLDGLQQIIGIGPTYSRRIYDAGITSVEELAELTGSSLQQIVTPGKSTPTAETENWLDQARQLSSS